MRLLLIAIVIALITGNALLLARHRRPEIVPLYIIHAGIDSLVIGASPTNRVTSFSNGRWTPNLEKAATLTEEMNGRKRRLWIVDLTSSSTYGDFLDAIRDLKTHRKCNIAMNVGADWVDPTGSKISSALVLCGTSIGDAGFTGTLPRDGPIPN
jgi:hypothetical protein